MKNQEIKNKIESILLVATKPLKISKINDLLPGVKKEQVAKAVEELQTKYNHEESGLRIIENRGVIQLTTSPDSADVTKQFVKDETTGELTKPSLETLTIVAYRQPITKAELEQIRGVNCSMILRNLMIRGLVRRKENKQSLTTYYSVTVEFLKFLGINRVEELPDYAKLNDNINLKKLLDPNYDDSIVIEEKSETEPVIDETVDIEEIDDAPATTLSVNVYH
ncbi:MAG: SMC-Scp complex subunit ScpB [Parcubacteria group bacterium CG1_02_37_51]|uniref:SMC-Scp complex subunit ScpB n=2 Tax=Candidatus Komeiliibacteriota TaxID=1817908 RepID=A0A2M8DS37_9BACT|nr:MAG: SMC-Scp complex subunit ScpB [Parcubacteria group bacterium CG1_02_37_51]PIY93762.1 MAG: SMC-Scp complex subunit ScpB [Candidatus Komeilibacteria bacterium CG_4_10_14_0_8_um_filter_37_78]PJC02180.1 MAG: SMC-Scp complex subunit ScpB [Candidatus Komeilibacteria bacterium CG_4_9_14_0_8_um_filter_36_9]